MPHDRPGPAPLRCPRRPDSARRLGRAQGSRGQPGPAGFGLGLLGLLSLIWGTSFILMKKGLLVFSALELGATRVSVAALLLLPFALREIGRAERSRLKWLALSGTVGTLIPAFK